jgi:hypothetical protein
MCNYTYESNSFFFNFIAVIQFRFIQRDSPLAFRDPVVES